jgi:hypothetical protein
MKRTRWFGPAALALALSAPSAAPARELEEILKDKGVLTEGEAKEAKEKGPAAPTGPVLPDWVSKFTPYGDVRIRNEAFFRKGDPDRNRDRFRLRFGSKVAVNDATELNFRLASGAAGDPISNNQSFSDTFTFKSINISNASVKVAPGPYIRRKPSCITLLGGKFDTPTYRASALLFDADLTPEGFFEAVKPVDEKSGFFRSVAVNLGQWIFQENSKTGEGAVYAFQGVGGFALGDSILANVGVADYSFNKASTIAVARNKNTSLNITNAVRLSDGTIVAGRSVDPAKAGPNKDGLDVNGDPITITGFVSDFNIVNAGGDLTLDTGAPHWPLKLFADFVKNTEAEGGDDTGFQVGAGIGANKDPGDLNFTYAYERLETEAVVSAFADSEFGDAGTNNEGHVLQLGYVLLKGLQLLSTAYIVEPVQNVAGRSTERLYRWQVDVIAKF